MKDLYGSAILFFYFLKWPLTLGLPLLYRQGLDNNPVMNIIWAVCLGLIIKELIRFLHAN